MRRIALVCGLAALLSACGSQSGTPTSVPSGGATGGSASTTTSPSSSASASASPSVVTVTYKVRGIGSQRAMLIVWSDGNGGSPQVSNQTLPWTQQLAGVAASGTYVLTAKNADSGAVTCEIDVDGKVVSTNTGSGPYSVAKCSS